MAGSVFSGVIEFFDRLGVYDVVLPFLLIFVIVYSILEKTRVLGTQELDGKQIAKKNINSMVAFVVAFLVIVSSKMVGYINKALPRITLLLLVLISFLMLIGVFFFEKEEVMLQGGWRTFFMILMFIGVVLIFMGVIETSSGTTWLEWTWDKVVNQYDSTAVSAIILLIVVVGIMFWVTKEPGEKKTEEKEGS